MRSKKRSTRSPPPAPKVQGRVHPGDVSRIAIVGTGTIGSGWAAVYLAKGYSVTAYVRTQASEDKFYSFLQSAWSKILVRGVASASDTDGWRRVKCVRSLAECVATADYVQESVVEELGLKQRIIQQIDDLAPPHVLIGTSSSFIPLSLVRARATRAPERIATAHPTLPQWDSFVEVLGSSAAHTDWLASFYGQERLRLDVAVLRKEMYGHAINALNAALSNTAFCLVNGGVCSMEDMDKSVLHLAKLIVASGGASGAMVGIVGGGSPQGATLLFTDMMLGAPVAMSACLVSWCHLPHALAAACLALLRLLGGYASLSFVKRLATWFVGLWCGPCFARWSALGGAAAFQERAIQRMSKIEEMD